MELQSERKRKMNNETLDLIILILEMIINKEKDKYQSDTHFCRELDYLFLMLKRSHNILR